MEHIVHVVHCIDTEGPLYEGLRAKLELLEHVVGITVADRTWEGFTRIVREGAGLTPEQRQRVREVFSPHRLHYLDTWDKLDAMLERVTAEEFRGALRDSFGGAYVYNWFCVDHVGYDINPRRRLIGYHEIFDHYADLLTRRANNARDGLHWHFHPMSFYKEAHRCAKSLLNSPHVWETLARRVIDREWFPSCYRAGFITERPDIHWFLEQYVPFDFSNTSEDSASFEQQNDLTGGQLGDWRLAPRDWGVYHPSHDNYQIPGNCRRWIARCLFALNRCANLDRREVDKAFAQAQTGAPTLMGIASHDFRDLGPEVDYVRGLLAEAQAKYPGVRFKFCEAGEAFRQVAYENVCGPALDLAVRLERSAHGMPAHVTVTTARGAVFGPQPFLAIKTRSGRYVHDNLDFSPDGTSWRYVFSVNSILPSDVAAVGVGASDRFGQTCVKTIHCSSEA
ncbi:MAG: hypothetical protein HY543_02185 [Deltaproteobacteria bacterium]|nr:hypothetical protein [Deltaproteobacteria bacterium]